MYYPIAENELKPHPYRHGLVVGKFYPPHRGHDHLIRTALGQVDELSIVVVAHATQTISPTRRASWMSSLYPEARVHVLTSDHLALDTPSQWAEAIVALLATPPDALFTSEDYGDGYAALLGCQHVMVDRNRVTIPCSGSLIRQNPQAYLHFLSPEVATYMRRYPEAL